MDDGDWLPGLDLLALSAIRKLDDRAYGLSIRGQLEASTGRPIARTDAYRVLDRLVGHGLAESRLGSPVSRRGGHARRYFHVTPAGLEVLEVCESALRGLAGVEGTSR
ncbi:MAG: PadR family transcriptional regulator [Gemmatimonadota bacterium]|jgi:DNA-binding PadR family transcriptional regulator